MRAIEESLVPLGETKIAAHKKAEDKIDTNFSTKQGITVTLGKDYVQTSASGTSGDSGDYDVYESYSVERKGKTSEYRVDGNSYVSKTSKKAEENGIDSGRKVSEGAIDIAAGTYPVDKQEIQKRDIYHGDDVELKVRKKRYKILGKESEFGTGMTKQTIKEGDPIPQHIKKLLIEKGMGDRVTVDAVVETVLKSDAYGTFTLIDKLGGRHVGELGLSPEFVNQMKNNPLKDIQDGDAIDLTGEEEPSSLKEGQVYKIKGELVKWDGEKFEPAE